MKEDEERLKRVTTQYGAAIECSHGLRAIDCGTCKQANLLLSRTRLGTFGDAIIRLVKDRVLNGIEIYDPIKQTHRHVSPSRLMFLSGVVLVGGILAVRHGKKIVVRLVLGSQKKT